MSALAIFMIGVNVALSIYCGLSGSSVASAVTGGGAVVSTLLLLAGYDK
jgi:hypothetical protein